MVRRVIVIDFDAEPDMGALVHRVRNLGEALHHACKDDGWCDIELRDVDRATDRLSVTVYSARRLRRVLATIERLLAENFFEGKARLSVTTEPASITR